MIYSFVGLLAFSMGLNAWLVVRIIHNQWREISKLQAAALTSRPVAAAVYQTYNPSDETSDFERLNDTPQAASRDMKPLGL